MFAFRRSPETREGRRSIHGGPVEDETEHSAVPDGAQEEQATFSPPPNGCGIGFVSPGTTRQLDIARDLAGAGGGFEAGARGLDHLSWMERAEPSVFERIDHPRAAQDAWLGPGRSARCSARKPGLAFRPPFVYPMNSSMRAMSSSGRSSPRKCLAPSNVPWG